MRKAIASSKSTSSALAAAWPSQLMVTRMVKSISSSESGDLGKNLGVEVLIWESHCSWEIVLLSGVAKSGKRQFENSCDEIITIIIQCNEREKLKSEFSGGFRTGLHEDDVRIKKDANAFYKHLQIFHPNAHGSIEDFDIQVQSVHKKTLSRQKTEAVKIATSTANNILNSKAEHRQPALLRVRMVRGDDGNDQVDRPRRRGRGE